ncbi:MAG: DUF4159 domain-containing protein [Gammaproteobacteria bacterium]|nr:DUF4159 domain-containing protein [Gammaproteobacteria bacterium]
MFLTTSSQAWLQSVVLAMVLGTPGAAVAQGVFREYPSFEGGNAEAPLPTDWQVPGELVIGRLMYPNAGRGFFGGGDWRQGNTSWTDDYPRGDRKLVQMLRRFTRINVRAVEQPINLEQADDAYYWPFMVVGMASPWNLTDEMAQTLREYLLRGGFLFVDSFFGSSDWIAFERSLNKVFPDRRVIDLSDDHPIFHNPYDLPRMTTVRIPNWNSLPYGYLGDGVQPHWRGVEDDHGRLMILIAFNNDVMDGWQWADDPRYPSEEANLALRLGVNVVLYALTH